MKLYNSQIHGQVSIICDHSSELQKGLVEGYIDIACLYNPPHDVGSIAAEWDEEFVWVRGKDFVVSPGAPLSLVGWPGGLSEQIAVNALEAKSLGYRLAFSSTDHHSCAAAVAAGIGLMVLPKMIVEPPLLKARDYYLPSLPQIRAGVCVRRDINEAQSRALVALLTTLVSDKRVQSNVPTDITTADRSISNYGGRAPDRGVRARE